MGFNRDKYQELVYTEWREEYIRPYRFSVWHVLSQAMACDKEPISALELSASPP